MAKNVKKEKAEEKDQSLQIQRGPRDLLDAYGINGQIHTPAFFHEASRMPHHLRVPREVPDPIAHHWSSQEGVPLAGFDRMSASA